MRLECIWVLSIRVTARLKPSATPARVALGMITMLACVTNSIALSYQMPSAKMTWLGRFVLLSLVFNLVAFTEQVLVRVERTIHALPPFHIQLSSTTEAILPSSPQVVVNLGLTIHSWLQAHRTMIEQALPKVHKGARIAPDGPRDCA